MTTRPTLNLFDVPLGKGATSLAWLTALSRYYLTAPGVGATITFAGVGTTIAGIVTAIAGPVGGVPLIKGDAGVSSRSSAFVGRMGEVNSAARRRAQGGGRGGRRQLLGVILLILSKSDPGQPATGSLDGSRGTQSDCEQGK
jgi:hypothetical protein